MFDIVYTNRMKKDVKLVKKQGKDLDKLIEIIDLLAKDEKLPDKYNDHSLKGMWQGFRECHIEPDWLLIYRIEEDMLYLVASGSHSYLRIVS